VRLLVDREVARLDDTLAGARVGLADLLLEHRRDAVDVLVELGLVVGLPADDQRRARLVDQDRIHLVDDGEGQAPLHAVLDALHHVVAQVVETVFVVRAVGDVGGVGGLLLLAAHLRQIDADRQAQEVVELAHPLGVAPRQVIVHRDQMDALARQRVQVDRQGGHQGLAFAGAHLGNLAVVEHHATDQLHVEVTHLQRALARLAHHGEGLGQQRIERLAGGMTLLQQASLVAQRGVIHALEARLQRIDRLHIATVLTQQALIAAAEQAGEDGGKHGGGEGSTGVPGHQQRLAAAGRCSAGAWGEPRGIQAPRAGSRWQQPKACEFSNALNWAGEAPQLPEAQHGPAGAASPGPARDPCALTRHCAR
jgi:hypothetical protein